MITNEEMDKLSQNIIDLSNKYHQARLDASKNKMEFNLILSSRMREFYGFKKNIGHETATLMLLEEKDAETTELYKSWNSSEADYKGLEKVISSLTERLWLGKKLMEVV